MRVLLINFCMDSESPVLAHQAQWASVLARKVEHLTVITEQVGRYEPAPNMTVHRIAPRPFGIPKRLGGGWLANILLWRWLRHEPLDVVFIHMAFEWAYRLAPVFRLFRLPVLFWYAHGEVSLRLRLALMMADRAVTPNHESLRIVSPKVVYVSQGIDGDLFQPPAKPQRRHVLVSVGRLSRSKRPDKIIDVLAALRTLQPDKDWQLQLAGPALTADDMALQQALTEKINAMSLTGKVEILGALRQAETVSLNQQAALHINLSETGSMDKTVMEALACGCPVLTTNPGFSRELNACPGLYQSDQPPAELAQAAIAVMDRHYSPEQLRALVVPAHTVEGCMNRIHNELAQLCTGQTPCAA